MQNTKKKRCGRIVFLCKKIRIFCDILMFFCRYYAEFFAIFGRFFWRLINVCQFFSDFFSVFGAGDKFRFLCTSEEEYAQRYAKGKQFRRRGGEPKPRHFP